MNGISIFVIGLASTMVVALFAIGYLQRHLRAILTDLCGTKERAAFWTAFSNVTLFLTPVIFALHFRPENGSTTALVYGLSDQIAAALLGFVAAIVMLGFVVGRFIARERIPQNAPRADAKG
jgi:predicted permease